jgi:hypothetical protein
MMKKIFGTLQIFPPRHYGTPVIARISAGMQRSASSRPSPTKNGREDPGHFRLKPIDDRYAWLATALPSAACAAANRAIGTR